MILGLHTLTHGLAHGLIIGAPHNKHLRTLPEMLAIGVTTKHPIPIFIPASLIGLMAQMVMASPMMAESI